VSPFEAWLRHQSAGTRANTLQSEEKDAKSNVGKKPSYPTSEGARVSQGLYVPPTDPHAIMRSTRTVIQGAIKIEDGVIKHRQIKAKHELDSFKNDMGKFGIDLESDDPLEDDPNLPKIPDNLSPEEKALLDPKIMAKQLREAELKRQEYEMMDDDLGEGKKSESEIEAELAADERYKSQANAAKRPQPVKGEIYAGRVTVLRAFGAFVDFGCAKNGLVALKEICEPAPRNVSDMLYLHDEVAVSVERIDKEGKVFLTMIGLNPALRPTRDRKPPKEPTEPVPPAVREISEDRKKNLARLRKELRQGRGVPDWDTVTDPLQRRLYEHDLWEITRENIRKDIMKGHRKAKKNIGDKADVSASTWHAHKHQVEMERLRELDKEMKEERGAFDKNFPKNEDGAAQGNSKSPPFPGPSTAQKANPKSGKRPTPKQAPKREKFDPDNPDGLKKRKTKELDLSKWPGYSPEIMAKRARGLGTLEYHDLAPGVKL